MVVAFFVLRIRTLVFVAAALIFGALMLSASKAGAYPGPVNVDGSSGAGYITTSVIGGVASGSCLGCHFGSTNPPTGLSINGLGLGTFSVPNDRATTFTLSYNVGSGKPYGGFLIAHNDGTSNDAGGTLGVGSDGSEHACGPLDGFPCNATSDGNTEVMHAAPKANSGGVVSFQFSFLPPAGSCATYGFNVWANNVNGDANCDGSDVPIEGSFAIAVTCPPSNDPCKSSTCNGSTCGTALLTGNPCNDGQLCTYNDTCTAGSCAGTAITCTSDDCNTRSCNGTSSCSVSSLNGTTCDDGQPCTVNDTCTSGTCVGTPTGSCSTQRPNGSACTGASQCASGLCVDEVCCNSSCTGQCQACNLPNSKGTCTAVTGQPVAPRTACAGDGTSCSGKCNGGATSCTFPPASTVCRTAGCTNDVATLAANCDGKGTCPTAATQKCAPYVCGPTQCDGACTVTAECNPGFYCSAGKCISLVAGGAACTSDQQCSTGHCVDDVCCDTRCSGECEACNVAGAVGTCSPLVNVQPHPPKVPCVTDGSPCGGICDGTSRVGCVYPGPSVSCRAASCTDGVATVGAACNGTGTCPALEQVTCGKACVGKLCGTECVTAGQCNQGQFCQAGRCAPQLENGGKCTNSSECISSFCVDGVCCDSSCSAQCEACDNNGNEGTCSAITGVPHGDRPICVGGTAACAGKCDGKNLTSCTYPAANKVCATGKCSGDVATLPRVCTGEGTCGVTQQQLCSPFTCGATQCNGNCTLDTDCPSGNYCSAGVCRPKNPLGAPCAGPNQCSSAFCVDGLCCNRACAGQCEACDSPTSTGMCTAIAGAPHNARTPCGGTGLCAGACDGSNANGCHFPTQTATCGNPACNGGIVADAPLCNGVGNCIASATVTDCFPLGCGPDGQSCLAECATNTDCAPGLSCSQGSCIGASADGGKGPVAPDGSAGPANGGATSHVDGGGGNAGSGGSTGAGGALGGDTPRDAGVSDAGVSDAGAIKSGSKGKTDQGCGCRVSTTTSGDARALFAGLAAISFIARRRTQKRAPPMAREARPSSIG